MSKYTKDQDDQLQRLKNMTGKCSPNWDLNGNKWHSHTVYAI